MTEPSGRPWISWLSFPYVEIRPIEEFGKMEV